MSDCEVESAAEQGEESFPEEPLNGPRSWERCECACGCRARGREDRQRCGTCAKRVHEKCCWHGPAQMCHRCHFDEWVPDGDFDGTSQREAGRVNRAVQVILAEEGITDPQILGLVTDRPTGDDVTPTRALRGGASWTTAHRGAVCRMGRSRTVSFEDCPESDPSRAATIRGGGSDAQL